MDTSVLVGKTLEEASALAAENGFTIRPTRIDGESLFGTCDMNRSRINVEVENNVITIVGRIG